VLVDDVSGSRRVDRDSVRLVRPLILIVRYRSLLQLVVDIVADLEILMQLLPVFGIALEPPGVPGAVDAEPEADCVDFLAHQAASICSSTSRTTIVRLEKGFSIRLARPRPRAWKRFMTIDFPT